MSKENMSLWDRVEKTDPKHTKKVSFGRSFTAIDPYYQIKCATEQFGPAGEGWGWEVVQLEEFIKTASVALKIRLWHGSRDNWIEQWGQSGLFVDAKQTKPDHDVMKKATTDGITKCLSYLGFNADVFTGKFDDNKYVQQVSAEFSQQVDTKPIDKTKIDNAIAFFRKEVAKDTWENHELVKAAWSRLSVDEQRAVTGGMNNLAEGSRKKEKSLLGDLISYVPPELNQ